MVTAVDPHIWNVEELQLYLIFGECELSLMNNIVMVVSYLVNDGKTFESYFGLFFKKISLSM